MKARILRFAFTHAVLTELQPMCWGDNASAAEAACSLQKHQVSATTVNTVVASETCVHEPLGIVQIAGKVHEARRVSPLRCSSDPVLTQINQLLDLYTKVTRCHSSGVVDPYRLCHTYAVCVYVLATTSSLNELQERVDGVCRTASSG